MSLESMEGSRQREVPGCYACLLNVCTQLCVSSELRSICVSVGKHEGNSAPG